MHNATSDAERPRRRLRAVVVVLGALLTCLLATPAFAVTSGPDGVQVPTPTSPTVGVGDGADVDPAQSPVTPAVPDVPQVPDVTIDLGDEGQLSQTVVVLILLTIGSMAPALLLLMTSFTRFVVVLGLTKNALGLQTIPPSQVLIGLALFLSFFTMAPTFTQINETAIQPYMAGELEQGDAFAAGYAPMREFMLAQTREDDLELFLDLAGGERPATPDEVSATTLIPAFVISELRAAFVMGFVIFLPFLIVDLVVAAVLMSMGMMMLPPVFVSLPLKLLLFVLVDGWALIAGSLVQSVA